MARTPKALEGADGVVSPDKVVVDHETAYTRNPKKGQKNILHLMNPLAYGGNAAAAGYCCHAGAAATATAEWVGQWRMQEVKRRLLTPELSFCAGD